MYCIFRVRWGATEYYTGDGWSYFLIKAKRFTDETAAYEQAGSIGGVVGDLKIV